MATQDRQHQMIPLEEQWGHVMQAVSDLADELAAAPGVWGYGYPPGEIVMAEVYQALSDRGLPIDRGAFAPPSRVVVLAERDGWSCAYCGTALGWGHPSVTPPEVEHVVPRARNGSDRLDNLVLACGPCNQAKGTMTGDEYRAAIA